jgi:hypothetical protein
VLSFVVLSLSSSNKEVVSLFSSDMSFIKAQWMTPHFHWGTVIEEEAKNLNLGALNQLICSLPSYTSLKGQTRKEDGKFIASQDKTTQCHISDELRKICSTTQHQIYARGVGC